MAYYYFPSCKATAQFKEAGKKARAYVKEQFGINPIGCCRPNHKKLTTEDTALAHKWYVEQFPHMFTPMEPEEQVEHFRRHCEQIKTEKVACYCKFCTGAINMGGKQGVHLLELLFPAQTEKL